MLHATFILRRHLKSAVVIILVATEEQTGHTSAL